MFCKFSNELNDTKNTLVDNYFITDVMPYANDRCVKIYFYGIYKCQNPDNHNTLKDFAEELNITEKEIEEAFWYWHQEGLVRVIELNPIEVLFLSPKNRRNRINKVDENKYQNFIYAVQSYFEGARQVLPTELNAYIDVMERYKMDSMAMLRIIKYCIDYKDKSINYPYIIQVAKNWANKGNLNLSAVEKQIEEVSLTEGKLLDILKALGIKRSATLEEKEMYIKWTDTFGFLYDTIMFVAKNQKRKGGTTKLDNLLTKYFEQKLMSEAEITEFENTRADNFTLAKNVSKALGKYYEVYDNVVDTYIIPWKAKGFDNNTIEIIANICFKSSVKTLEDMDKYIQKLFKLGITTEDSIAEYVGEIQSVDNKISAIFETLGIVRKVRAGDRSLYKTWKDDWKIDDELIDYVAKMSYGKENPISYFNKVISNYYNQGITDLKSLKEKQPSTKNNEEVKTSKLKIYNYTDEELVAMFDNLDEVEI